MVKFLKILIYIVFSTASLEAAAQFFENPRPMGMGGAHRAVADGNDALYLNPAGFSAYRAYTIDASYARNFWANANYLNASIKDSETAYPLGAGFGFTYMNEDFRLRDFKGFRIDFGLSYMPLQWLSIGATIRYYHFDRVREEGKWRNFTIDAGILFPIHRYISLAITGNNLIPVGDEPPSIRSAAGIRMGDPAFFSLLFDLEQDYKSRDKITLIYHAGAEIMLSQWVALRAGYIDDSAYLQKYFTCGAGFISPRFGLDFGFKQRVGGGLYPTKEDRIFSLGTRLFL